jgi:mono/diheme cytochrome c family protein
MISLEVKGTILALGAALGVLGVTFGLAVSLQSRIVAKTKPTQQDAPISTAMAIAGGEANRGHTLFEKNCAHCHGDDARGDEGPNLHNLVKSDDRIASIIKGGIKGEMPAFRKKFNDDDVLALVSYLRTLVD